ncbi:PLP-dependent aminotransferase family protein [Ruminococcaceae bacterium OttesenSCG-928-A11]|nr:PLP-dependent aminotransferase family protein [Ruminococcaceae bacterium OttesenSCG-928-A11]
MELSFSKTNSTPIYLQIKNQIKHKIMKQELAYGFRLPSERALSDDLGIHRNTVHKVYGQLVDEGLLKVVSKQHYIVCYTPFSQISPARPPQIINWKLLLKDTYYKPDNLYDTMIEQTLTGKYISFAAEFASPHIYPHDEIRGILGKIAQITDLKLFNYTETQGLLSLRQAICKYLERRQIYVTPNQIQVFSEVTQALKCIFQLFLSEGDYIILEEPLHFDTYVMLLDMRVQVVTIPTDEDGMMVELLEPLLQRFKPKCIYTNPTFNNPTKAIMPLERRHRLMELSAYYGIPVVEEDTLHDLYYGQAPMPAPIKALDPKNHVIYVDSFTQTFVPGIRVSFAVAPAYVIRKFNYMIIRDFMQLDSVSQLMLTESLGNGSYWSNLDRINNMYREKLTMMCRELDRAGPELISYAVPSGGPGLWCRLPNHIDQGRLLKVVMGKGVLFMPGHIMYRNGSTGDNYIRLNHTYPEMDNILDGIRILVDVLQKMVSA